MILIWGAEAITDPRFREHMLGPFRVGLDFLTQLANIDAQVLRVRELVPKLAQEELMGQHLSRVLHQDAQEIVFLRRELDLSIGDFHDAPHQIYGKIADTKDRSLAVQLQLMP